ncbi:MAG: hypothetical protein P8189_02625 [Anaerolineae bacterium]|jgi:hypothetical protein
MDKTVDSLVVKRLVRNLQYRQTYIKVFEDFSSSGFHPQVIKLLSSLVETQQTAVVALSRYLRALGVDTQDPVVYHKLLQQAAERQGTSAQLRFIHYGLRKSVSWYKTQLIDRQMTADPELQNLLLELGENEAASLWRTEAVMVLLRIHSESEPRRPRGALRAKPDQEDSWRPRLMDPSRHTA